MNGDDRSWFEGLVRVQTRPAVKFALMQVQDIHVAEDIVQEAFTRAWRSPRTPSGQVEFRRWLYRVITNLARDHQRRQARQARVLLDPRADADPIVESQRRAGNPTLMAALLDLTLRERQAIYLRYFEDLSFRDTARIMRMPQVTLRVIVHRALLKLRGRLADNPAAREVMV